MPAEIRTPSLFLRASVIVIMVIYSVVSWYGRAEAESKKNQHSDLFRYLVECALPEGKSVTRGGVRYFGSMGFAPNWENSPLEDDIKPLISACLLARTNALGSKVEISIRGGFELISEYEILATTDEEVEEFSFFEGAFFGNLFLDRPAAFVCYGSKNEHYLKFVTERRRLCAIPIVSNLDDSMELPISICGFTIVGPCNDKSVFLQDGRLYTEALFVYLKNVD